MKHINQEKVLTDARVKLKNACDEAVKAEQDLFIETTKV